MSEDSDIDGDLLDNVDEYEIGTDVYDEDTDESVEEKAESEEGEDK